MSNIAGCAEDVSRLLDGTDPSARQAILGVEINGSIDLVRFQLVSLPSLVAWATARDEAIHLSDRGSHVSASIEFATAYATVHMWVWLTHSLAYRSLLRLGYDEFPDSGIAVTPSQLGSLEARAGVAG